jgi:hypothetical protein
LDRFKRVGTGQLVDNTRLGRLAVMELFWSLLRGDDEQARVRRNEHDVSVQKATVVEPR